MSQSSKNRKDQAHPAKAAEAHRLGLYRKVLASSEVLALVTSMPPEVWSALTEKLTQETPLEAIQAARNCLTPVETLVSRNDQVEAAEELRQKLLQRVNGSTELAKRVKVLGLEVQSAMQATLTLDTPSDVIKATRELLASVKALVAKYDGEKAEELKQRQKAKDEARALAQDAERDRLMAAVDVHPLRSKIRGSFGSNDLLILDGKRDPSSTGQMAALLDRVWEELKRRSRTSGYDIEAYFERVERERAKALADEAAEAEAAEALAA